VTYSSNQSVGKSVHNHTYSSDIPNNKQCHYCSSGTKMSSRRHTTADKMYSCFNVGNPQKTAAVKPAKHVSAAPRTCLELNWQHH
jgi:hypothetical protein